MVTIIGMVTILGIVVILRIFTILRDSYFPKGSSIMELIKNFNSDTNKTETEEQR